MEKIYVTQTTVPRTDYMSAGEVATALGLSKMTVYRMCDAGTLAHIRTGVGGKVYRILRVSYEQHIAAVKSPAPAPVIPGQSEIAV